MARAVEEWGTLLLLAFVLLWLGGGAQTARADEAEQGAPAAQEVPSEPSDEFDDSDDLYYDDSEEEEDGGDPFETMNRGIFWINDGLDRYAIEPVSTAWDFVLPDVVQRSLRSAFDNLRFPIVFFNDLFQGKPKEAGQDLARFLLNSTVGIGGFLDPASSIGLKPHNEDFGQTLGYWGLPPGPYLMLPFFGPSNVRDGCGLIVDTGFRAFGFFIPFWVSAAMQGVDTLNRRSLIREEIATERRAALDWYAAVRSAYSQYRENLVQDKRQAAEEGSEFRRYYPLFESHEEKP
jgi:phospholipid-binding lipoprotein MlaA